MMATHTITKATRVNTPTKLAPLSDSKMTATIKQPTSLHEKTIMDNIGKILPKLLPKTEYEDVETSEQIDYVRSKVTSNPDRDLRKRLIEFARPLGLCDLCIKIWKTNFNDQYHLESNHLKFSIMKHAMSILWNGTDSSPKLCTEALDKDLHTYFIQLLAHPLLVKSNDNNALVYTIKGILGIFHNFFQYDERSRAMLREMGAVDKIKIFCSHPVIMVQCKATFCLAYIVDKSQNEMLNSDTKNFRFLATMLTDSLKSKDYQSRRYGYSAFELLCVINLIAATDTNKQRIKDSGLYELYIKSLKTTDESLQLQAIEGIWSLSFNKDLKALIKADQDVMNALQKFKKGNQAKLKEAAEGALWILEDEGLKVKEETKSKKDKDAESKEKQGNNQHVMISYNHSSQERILWVRDQLKNAGIKVWIDVEDMNGSILNGMAQGVQNASVVLICFSQKYFESPNCRLEAEYVHKKNKPFIPLRLEYRYDPEDWLGIMLGNSLYYDFSREQKLQSSIEGLIKDIHRRNSGESAIQAELAPNLGGKPPAAPNKHQQFQPPVDMVDGSSAVLSWKSSDVEKWLKENGIAELAMLFKDYSGALLLELKYMYQSAPEAFYKSMKEEYKLPLLKVLKVTKALKLL